jgi:predicted phage-related endonuclease
MANDQHDFAPEIRNAAWWSGDSRKVANGRAVDVILEKTGKKELPDLSAVEAVQMGHVMQPVIGRLASNKLNLELKDADYSLTHAQHNWFRSHFDFISADGRTLVEVKNYNSAVRNKFDTDHVRVPPADYAQLVHEAAVHNVDHIVLAVLFGGQEFCTFDFTISQQEKDDLIKQMAVYWAHVQTNTMPPLETVEQTKIVYPTSNDQVIIANQSVENAIANLKHYKQQIKQLEELSENVEMQLRNLMADNSEIRSVDGSTLVSWKNAKPSNRFSADLFRQAMPDIYDKFVIEQPGSRRFLVK